MIGECQSQVLHGMTEEVIFCKNHKKLSLETIFDYFKDERFPSMKGKPKLFFIEVCIYIGNKSNLKLF